MKDPKDIKRLNSHTYELPWYRIGPDGAEDAGMEIIQFCKGSKENPVQEGLFTESLIELCRIHLESVNQGDLENPYTTSAINSLKGALWFLNERVEDRKLRGVLQTYQK